MLNYLCFEVNCMYTVCDLGFCILFILEAISSHLNTACVVRAADAENRLNIFSHGRETATVHVKLFLK